MKTNDIDTPAHFTVRLAPKGKINEEPCKTVRITAVDYRTALAEAHRLYPEYDVAYCWGPLIN